MATRLVGVDSDDPKLPDVVIDATIGTTVGTLASGQAVATAQAAAESAASDAVEAKEFAKAVPHYGLSVDIDAPGFLVIGFDPATDTTYAVHEKAVQVLLASTDLKVWRTVHEFVGATRVGSVFVTAAGTILARADTTLYRSDDGGDTWTSVLVDPLMGSTARSFCQLASGTILYGNYHAPSGATVYTLNLWRSTDDGVTWEVARSWVDAGNGVSNPVRHIHAVRADPYVAGRVWMALGDGDWQASIQYSDDEGDTWTVIGSGDQTWRTVDILFTADAVIWGCDGNSINEHVMSWDRTTEVRTDISRSANNSLYYGGIDSQGRMVYATVYEPGTIIRPEANVFVGPADGSQLLDNALRVPVIPGGSNVGLVLYGPDSNDCWIFGVNQTPASGRNPYRTFRAKVTDTEQPAIQQLLDQPQPKTVGPVFLEVGPHPNTVGTSQNTATPNRLYFQKFRTDVNLVVRKIMLGIGSAPGTNCVVGIADSNDGGNAETVMGQSALTPVSVTSGALTVSLETPVVLTAGVDYWAFIAFDAATAFRSVGSLLPTSALYRVLGVASLPPTSPLGNQSSSSLAFPLVLLSL